MLQGQELKNKGEAKVGFAFILEECYLSAPRPPAAMPVQRFPKELLAQSFDAVIMIPMITPRRP